MTDPEGSTVQDDWRAALAAQLKEQFSYAAQYATVVLDWDEEADELMPVVRRIVAAELRAATKECPTTAWYRWFNARADDIEAGDQAVTEEDLGVDQPTPKKKIPVTVEEVLAARITVATEARLGRIAPIWVMRLAETDIPLRLIEETP